ncbi:CHAT domain-containing protein [Magnetospirillum sulfuroxidans]|uniref:CHAT domain-containing protein n=1 Tax=Magnetospirillum sulfuroxidans TaxID=611300 RepID=A0ABS5IER0_9PROT|nr:CHAT domain-containing protein [Magnetospirillum sulfuroxidans]MBR9972899.1 CHAT domain-containing protein [Magnetospirillum sulfuroxidans]
MKGWRQIDISKWRTNDFAFLHGEAVLPSVFPHYFDIYFEEGSAPQKCRGSPSATENERTRTLVWDMFGSLRHRHGAMEWDGVPHESRCKSGYYDIPPPFSFDDKDAAHHNFMGIYYSVCDHWRAAMEAFSKAVSLDPENHEYCFNYAYVRSRDESRVGVISQSLYSFDLETKALMQRAYRSASGHIGYKIGLAVCYFNVDEYDLSADLYLESYRDISSKLKIVGQHANGLALYNAIASYALADRWSTVRHLCRELLNYLQVEPSALNDHHIDATVHMRELALQHEHGNTGPINLIARLSLSEALEKSPYFRRIRQEMRNDLEASKGSARSANSINQEQIRELVGHIESVLEVAGDRVSQLANATAAAAAAMLPPPAILSDYAQSNADLKSHLGGNPLDATAHETLFRLRDRYGRATRLDSAHHLAAAYFDEGYRVDAVLLLGATPPCLSQLDVSIFSEDERAVLGRGIFFGFCYSLEPSDGPALLCEALGHFAKLNFEDERFTPLLPLLVFAARLHLAASEMFSDADGAKVPWKEQSHWLSSIGVAEDTYDSYSRYYRAHPRDLRDFNRAVALTERAVTLAEKAGDPQLPAYRTELAGLLLKAFARSSHREARIRAYGILDDMLAGGHLDVLAGHMGRLVADAGRLLEAPKYLPQAALRIGRRLRDATDLFDRLGEIARILRRNLPMREDKEHWIGASETLGRMAAHAWYLRGKPERAVAWLEAGQASLQSDLLRLYEVNLGHLPDAWQAVQLDYETARDRWVEAGRNGRAAETQAAWRALEKITGELEELGFGPQLAPAAAGAARAAARAMGKPLVYLSATDHGVLAFMATPKGRVIGTKLSVDGKWLSQRLHRHLRRYDDFRTALQAWKALREAKGLDDLANQRHPAMTWITDAEDADIARSRLEPRITHFLDDLELLSRDLVEVMAPLVDMVKRYGFTSVVVVPCGELVLLPLQLAAYRPTQQRRLRRLVTALGLADTVKCHPGKGHCGLEPPQEAVLDKISLVFSPNASVLLRRKEVGERPSIGAYGLWDDELDSKGQATCEIVARHTPHAAEENRDLDPEEVLARLRSARHFAYLGHGSAVAGPRALDLSGLAWKVGRHWTRLSIRSLLADEFPHLDHADLTACDGARANPDVPSEVVLLPTALLYAGARTVSAHSWTVLNSHAIELSRRFHQRWAANPEADRAELQRQIQVEYRDSNVAPNLTGRHAFDVSVVITEEEAEAIAEAMEDPWPDPTKRLPSGHPYAWASVQCWGMAMGGLGHGMQGGGDVG